MIVILFIQLIKHTKLKLINKTSKSIDNISYVDKIKKDPLLNNDVWEIDFHNAVSGKLQFNIWSQEENKSISVILKDEVVVRKNEVMELVLTPSSLVIQEGKTEIISIRKLLGISTLKVINQTSVKKVKEISYQGIVYDKVLLKGATYEIYFNEPTNGYLSFVIEAGLIEVDLKIKEKIIIAKAEEKIIILTNETEVIVSGDNNKTAKIMDLLNCAILSITNATTVDLLNVEYDDFHTTMLESNITISDGFYNITQVPRPISFEVRTENSVIKLKTKDIISLHHGEEVKYTITNETLVIKDGTNKYITLKNVLGITL